MSRFVALFYAVPMSVNALVGWFGAVRAEQEDQLIRGLYFLVAGAATAIAVWVARDWVFSGTKWLERRFPLLSGLEEPEAKECTRIAKEALANWAKRG